MKRIFQIICIISAVFILLPSCDGNVFVKPDINKEVKPTVEKLKTHLEVSTGFKIEAQDVRDLIVSYFEPEEGEEWIVPKEDIEALLSKLIPETFDVEIDFKNIPKIDDDTMLALLLLDTPQDISLVNRILSVPLYNPEKSQEEQSNPYVAVKLLYETVLKNFKNDDAGLVQIGNALLIPNDYHTLTYGDYIAVQLLVSLIFETLPSSVIRNYMEYIPKNEETKLNEYIAELGDNMVKALIIDDSIIRHVLGIYTFLNKYNPSTTILDMKNLGTFFALDEEVQ